jgi:4Fe-4S ferredoxin
MSPGVNPGVSMEACRHSPGEYRPQIDRDRCEGKDECVRVCPVHVFQVRKLTLEERQALAFLSRLKAAAHGNRQSFAVHAELCEACGLCVKACPERAITLLRCAV